MSNISDEEKIRGWIRQILVETHSVPTYRLLSEQDAFDKAFIEPFKDIFKVAKVAAKDMLTSAKFAFDILVTIDPKKLKEIRQNYRKRQEQIKKDYGKALESTEAIMNRPDVKLAGFLLNPGAYLASSALIGAYENKEEIKNFFKEAGFGEPSRPEKERDPEIKDPTGLIGTAFDALKKLFFFETSQLLIPGSHILSERQGEGDKQAMVTQALKELGALDEIGEMFDDFESMVEKDLASITDEFYPRFETIDAIAASKSIKELEENLKKAEQSGLTIEGDLASVSQDMEQQVDKIMSDPKVKKQYIATLTGKEDISDEDVASADDGKLRETIREKLYIASTDSIRDAMTKSKKNLASQLQKEVEDYAKFQGIDEASIGEVGKTPAGEKIVKHLQDALKIVETPPATSPPDTLKMN